MDDLEDHEILIGIKNRDERAVNYLYTKSFVSVGKLINSNGGCDDDARDIFQECLMVLYLKVRDTDFKLTSSLNTYIYAIAKNLWYRKFKKTAVYEFNIEAEQLEDQEDILYRIHEKEKKEYLYTKLNELKDECKRLLSLVLEGKSNEELQNKMKYNSIQYTKNRKLHCKNKLIKNILKDPEFKHLYNG